MVSLKAAADTDTRLATYGTLAPGRINHGQVEDLGGKWSTGFVRGRLIEAGWGAQHGCPGLAIDPEGEAIEVFLLTAPGLKDRWPQLDAFEGTGYCRAAVDVETESGTVSAWIYVLSEESLSDAG